MALALAGLEPYRALWCSTVPKSARLTTNDHGTVIILEQEG